MAPKHRDESSAHVLWSCCYCLHPMHFILSLKLLALHAYLLKVIHDFLLKFWENYHSEIFSKLFHNRFLSIMGLIAVKIFSKSLIHVLIEI
jgi:hypothetical protein